MADADPDPYARHVHQASHARAELALLGAHVEAARRQYASALEQLSIEAAIALPPSELQRLHDLNAELERALRVGLAAQEASRPSRQGEGSGADAAAGMLGRHAAPVLAGDAAAASSDESAVCSLQ